ncbi:hypothetical protein A3C23_01275 [Candidatus Roizmanbacteria bacterium RIFCSPHIGHO2_02_FULL_37_13b]|uniref:Antitoxin n=1 Tax=Candidatus Roizmanbacteria bacterium RIFCSPLOWO2_02_FULL_36_11 TaxID=1802071 RepID=A0A1F7JHE6_9BACT|nr:MAG: hypothetical protein A3C23_01275 [Candidatus Roizmanbacteria bacterium RIFCSPHIGHO2_02_FULL_37_13b]OGK55029.1 MAG: hypothetical protein A3H78_00960 [Candidatus Roizmanbacteria bacterium RIFCSPLOWO2_02_FULL_36_11]
MIRQLITSEEFTSIQEAQAGLAKIFARAAERGSFYRVLRNNLSLGVLIPDNIWESLLEDLEALSSTSYLTMIEKSRQSKKLYSAIDVKKRLRFK